MSLFTYYIASSASEAYVAAASGVSCIFIDLETEGKALRQNKFSTHLSSQSLSAVKPIVRMLRDSFVGVEIMVRVNPISDSSYDEISYIRSCGVDKIMLPYFKTLTEVSAFYQFIGDCGAVLLFETKESISSFKSFVPFVRSIDRLHFGLNDLALEYSLNNPLQILCNDILLQPARLCHTSGISFGIGGVGSGHNALIPPKYILSRLSYFNSSWVILSRNFRSYYSSSSSNVENISNLTRELLVLQELSVLASRKPMTSGEFASIFNNSFQ